jgi:nitrite reductase/ring-hydroxylating ferredoxin subunit
MDTPTTDFVRAGSLEELKAKGRLVAHGRHRPILVVDDKGRVFALDNRCFHLGFPLDRGSVDDPDLGTADRDGHIDAVRGALHGAMALYLARYLNVPSARIPGDGGEPLDDLPASAEDICVALLEAFDRQRQVDLAARLVARHFTLGHSVQALIATLARALLREDAGFHAYRVLDAGVRQFGEWGNTDEGRSSSPSTAISLPIRLRNAPSCKRPKSPGGSCAAVSFIRKPQRGQRLCVPKNSFGDDFGFRR